MLEVLNFSMSKKLKFCLQNFQNQHCQKKETALHIMFFFNESGISKSKEFGLAGAICLIWRTRCNVLLKGLKSGSRTDNNIFI